MSYSIKNKKNKVHGSKTYIEKIHNVIYNGNGNMHGTVPFDNNKYWRGRIVTVLGNTGVLKKDGYGFYNWNTKPDGKGTSYNENDTFEMYYDNVILYATWTNYSISSVGPTGGFICYDKGECSDSWRYLECASIDQSDGIVWNNASQLCTSYNLNGYTDWYLPSLEELNLMYINLKQNGIGNFADEYYWSSTEFNEAGAAVQRFSDGTQANSNKEILRKVRVIRAF